MLLLQLFLLWAVGITWIVEGGEIQPLPPVDPPPDSYYFFPPRRAIGKGPALDGTNLPYNNGNWVCDEINNYPAARTYLGTNFGFIFFFLGSRNDDMFSSYEVIYAKGTSSLFSTLESTRQMFLNGIPSTIHQMTFDARYKSAQGLLKRAASLARYFCAYKEPFSYLPMYQYFEYYSLLAMCTRYNPQDAWGVRNGIGPGEFYSYCSQTSPFDLMAFVDKFAPKLGPVDNPYDSLAYHMIAGECVGQNAFLDD